jgi:phosphohistidine phosphatase
MIIYLMRHGLAERPALGQEDATRRLTEQGHADVSQVAHALAEVQSGLEYLFSSPYLRARQTAELVASAVGMPVQIDRHLAPGCTLDALEELHVAYGAPQRFMAVGHQPDVGNLVQAMTGQVISVREGSLIIIEASVLKPRCGVLQGVFAPEATSDLIQILRNE